MKCLRCGTEYEHGFNICADCNAPLVPDDYNENSGTIEATVEEYINESANNKSSILDPFVRHLESIGFQIEKDGDFIKAIHSGLEPVHLTEYEKGIIFEIWYKPNENSKNNRLEYLEFVNHLNNDVPIIRATDRLHENALVLDSWIPGKYDKGSFDVFLTLFISEMNVILHNEKFNKYLTRY